MDRHSVLIEEMPAFIRVPDQATFGGNHRLVAPTPNGFADDLFGSTQAVSGRRIDQGDARIE